ncbi:hypothetical protein DMUE_1463 [Dictyocoela muelleri]|nr:hypothetical protein DMUE_1463 [Dictyocoela muelleri]
MIDDYEESEGNSRGIDNKDMPIDELLEDCSRKERQVITMDTVKCFINSLNDSRAPKDKVPIFNLSLKTIRKLASRYLESEFFDVSVFKSGPEKKKKQKRYLFCKKYHSS